MNKLIPFIFFLLFGFYGSANCFGQVPVVQQPAPYLYVPQVYYAPSVVYVPQVQAVPYQYQRTEVYRQDYRTPLRNLLFGRYRAYDFYSPVENQKR